MWPPIVRESHYAGAALTPLVLVLNAMKLPTLASAWLLGLTDILFFLIGRVEPEAVELAISFITNALAAWFVFPSWRRAASWIATIGSFCMMCALVWLLRRHPPADPTGFDVPYFGASNRITFFMIIVAIGIYAARAMAFAERELVAEREKTVGMLKSEVSHQVAERSRELGEALARIEAPVAAPALAPGDRFQARYRVHGVIGEVEWAWCTRSNASPTTSASRSS